MKFKTAVKHSVSVVSFLLLLLMVAIPVAISSPIYVYEYNSLVMVPDQWNYSVEQSTTQQLSVMLTTTSLIMPGFYLPSDLQGYYLVKGQNQGVTNQGLPPWAPPDTWAIMWADGSLRGGVFPHFEISSIDTNGLPTAWKIQVTSGGNFVYKSSSGSEAVDGFPAGTDFIGYGGGSYSADSVGQWSLTIENNPVPEPSTILLLGIGLGMVVFTTLKRKYNI